MYNKEGVVFDKSSGNISLTAPGLCSSEWWSWEYNKVKFNKQLT